MKYADAVKQIEGYGVALDQVEGFKELDDVNRATFVKFLVNFYELQLVAIDEIVPLSVYFVEEVEYLVKEGDYDLVAGVRAFSIDNTGASELIDEFIEEGYSLEDAREQEPVRYLRFEYRVDGKEEWLHVAEQGSEWY